ncbi:hypothetical protein CO683_00920 [Bradyrhizobium ottawaense]|uniref:hypothetical protein n=1 Tax=Bradyrhizobium ottawaense TaxID=931866 RepID=UPI000BE8B64E|nr:hypothetical protein [Bradyrhizobium ottawaense]PDT71753.1 hypothetical protein CO683_00920 [Bradyrhizobium ottawaense]
MTEHALTLRQAADGDYHVYREGRLIGRIRKTEDHVHGSVVWSWNITVPLPVSAWTRGSADSLEAAQKAFRAAWEQFYASLSPEQIARWHHTQDARIVRKP